MATFGHLLMLDVLPWCCLSVAPEVIEMAGWSSASDIWSVGCTIIELLTTKPPYFGLAPMAALFRIVQEDHPPLPQRMSPVTTAN